MSTMPRMFMFSGSPVPVREDLKDAYRTIWDHMSRPGPVFDADHRIRMLQTARSGIDANATATDDASALEFLAATLYEDPGSVDRSTVAASIAEMGEPGTVETIFLVSMLAAVDGTHRALGAELEPLPQPLNGVRTRQIALGMERRRSHVSMPRNSITVALDLLPAEGAAYAAMCGPQYMTFAEMVDPTFERSPGLNRAQLETVASRTSLLNECFY